MSRAQAVRSITYPSADGAQIPAYLTVPAGREARNPAVVLPHGGPAARDEWEFDWLAQYLASQGYVVLQPNYRGSAGYSDQWLQQNGFRSWRTSISDITAGAHGLSPSIADANRMAILDWSYGGYAALQSGVDGPKACSRRSSRSLRCSTCSRPRTTSATRNARVADFIGSGTHIEEGSPLRHAGDQARAIFHGNRDLSVPIVHSVRMNQALQMRAVAANSSSSMASSTTSRIRAPVRRCCSGSAPSCQATWDRRRPAH